MQNNIARFDGTSAEEARSARQSQTGMGRAVHSFLQRAGLAKRPLTPQESLVLIQNTLTELHRQEQDLQRQMEFHLQKAKEYQVKGAKAPAVRHYKLRQTLEKESESVSQSILYYERSRLAFQRAINTQVRVETAARIVPAMRAVELMADDELDALMAETDESMHEMNEDLDRAQLQMNAEDALDQDEQELEIMQELASMSMPASYAAPVQSSVPAHLFPGMQLGAPSAVSAKPATYRVVQLPSAPTYVLPQSAKRDAGTDAWAAALLKN